MTKPENETPLFWFKRVEELEADLRYAEEAKISAEGAASHARLFDTNDPRVGDPDLNAAAIAARTTVENLKEDIFNARNLLIAAEHRDQAARANLVKVEVQEKAAVLVVDAQQVEESALEFAHAIRSFFVSGAEVVRSVKKASQMYSADQRRDGRLMTGEWVEVLAQKTHLKRRIEIELHRLLGDLWPVDFEVPMAALHTPFSAATKELTERAVMETEIYLDAKA